MHRPDCPLYVNLIPNNPMIFKGKDKKEKEMSSN